MKEKIVMLLNRIKPDVDFLNVTNLLESGVFSSLEFFTFVENLSVEFNVEIGVEDMIPENFITVDSICEMIANIRG